MNTDPETTVIAPFATDPPVELLDWIGAGDKADQALATKELYQRYCGWLFKVLQKRLPQYDGDFLSDFVIQTFSVVFKNADRFRRISDEDSVLQERRFKKWMLTIANNLYNSWNRKQAPATTMDEEFWLLAAERPDQKAPNERSTPEMEAIAAAMAELSDRDRSILYAYLSHCPDITNRQSKLPRNMISELCSAYKTTPENLRTIRSRAMKKVRIHLETKGFTL